MDEASVVGLPDGLHARIASDDDVPATVEFWNRSARPQQRRGAADARRWRAQDADPTQLQLIVEAGRTVAAVAETGAGTLFALPGNVWRGGVRVDPVWRRRGVASVLLERLEGAARAGGAAAIQSSVRGDEPEGLGFAQARGYQEFHRRYNAYLDLPAFDAAPFGDPDSVARAAGVRLVSWGEAMATHAGDLEAFQRHLYDVGNELVRDVPRPDLWTPPPFERVRSMMFESPTLDQRASILVMQGDEVVGQTVTDVNELGVGYTFMTGVARPLRKRGLALAMKLRAIAALKRRGVRWFGTTNDEANAAMRGINARLGYVVDPPTIMVKKQLA